MGAQGERQLEKGKWVNDMNMSLHTDKGLYGPQSDNDYPPPPPQCKDLNTSAQNTKKVISYKIKIQDYMQELMSKKDYLSQFTSNQPLR
jgi:hypothetical protein